MLSMIIELYYSTPDVILVQRSVIFIPCDPPSSNQIDKNPPSSYENVPLKI